MSVSYTHLDVYKRQVLRSILVQNTPQPGMIADIQSTAEMAKVAEQLKYATIAVSYTHLDVYKRQGVCFADPAAWLTTGILLIVTYYVWEMRMRQKIQIK